MIQTCFFFLTSSSRSSFFLFRSCIRSRNSFSFASCCTRCDNRQFSLLTIDAVSNASPMQKNDIDITYNIYSNAL